MRRSYVLAAVGFVVVVAAVVAIAVGGDDDEGDRTQPEVAVSVSDAAGISEDNLPPGFERTPAVELEGKRWTFDEIPGHYWKVLDDRGFAVGLQFQTEEPFAWAEDVPEGELLYTIYAIPGNCGNGSYEQAVKSENASIVGPLPGGFDHWHAVVGEQQNGGSRTGHWLMHFPVRDFTFAGEEGNPLAGQPVTAGDPGFIPVCDIR